MNSDRPGDSILQEYAADRNNCRPAQIQHIEHCSVCMATVRDYRALFSGIVDMPKTSFGFDVTALVMEHIPAQSQVSQRRAIWPALLLAALALIPVWIFSGNFLSLFGSIAPYFFFVILGAAVLGIGWSAWNQYRVFRRKLFLIDA